MQRVTQTRDSNQLSWLLIVFTGNMYIIWVLHAQHMGITCTAHEYHMQTMCQVVCLFCCEMLSDICIKCFKMYFTLLLLPLLLLL